jgi:exoribonuclease R
MLLPYAVKVVGILERRKSRMVVGVLRPSSSSDHVKMTDSFAFLLPQDARAPRLLVSLDAHRERLDLVNEEVLNTHLFLGEMTSWQASSRFARGRVINRLGKVGEFDAEVSALLQGNAVFHGEEFEDHVMGEVVRHEVTGGLGEARDGEYQVPDEELARRRDLRDW